ncbi:hypothetical protein HC251_18200 [Iamia sp. SCSIO 61187]|uniref:hypothetical protein n=1 Tax=Iamia sp. SCSIO 61187 TaxID=2722752 RepID=UPI001C638CA3|nr:hypothetical protein [Iamia sp. SCSIO 61187]QYG94181.1 hypothetical protein HC251_18200 [Iamia sp. SCSIO 61187]
MALIAANRLTVTIPTAPDDPPSEATARERITRWLEGEYGYPPPVESLEGHGWSARWEVGGRITPGWRYDAVIPRHLGPSRDDVAKARHPAAGARRPAGSARPARPSGRGSTTRPRSRPATARPASGTPVPELADALGRIDSLFSSGDDLGG